MAESDAKRLARLDREAMRRGSAPRGGGYVANLRNFKNNLGESMKPSTTPSPTSTTLKPH